VEEVLNELSPEVEHLLWFLASQEVVGSGSFSLTNYIIFMTIAVLLLLAFVWVGVKRLQLVPTSKVANGFEMLVEMVRNSIVGDMLGSERTRKYFPFIGSIFFFILINNLLGLVPGSRPGTGTMGVTFALAFCSFVVFNAAGIKHHHGVFGYLKSFAPKGVPFPINALVWFIEIFSSTLRLLTLAVRLFANMYAGHIIIGVFALLTSLFLAPLAQEISVMSVGSGLASIAWVALLVAIYFLEMLVAVVQAYVFTILSTVYVNLATAEH